MEKRKPIEKFRSGGVEAAVWENTGKNGSFYSVSVSRTFKKDGKLQETNSYGRSDLVHLTIVSTQAWFFIAKKRDENEQAA